LPRAHTRGACFARHTGPGTGLPHGVEWRYSPAPCGRPCRRRDCPSVSQASRTGQHGAASGPVRSPPLLYRSGVSSARAPARRVASSLRSCAHAAFFPLPSVAAAVNPAERPPRTRPRAHTRGAASQPYRTASACRAGVTGR
jgi:hypothetical protein